MQTTFRKQSASAILKTARVEIMRAGNAEIVVTLPRHKQTVIANLGERNDGWGGTVADVLALDDVDGLVCRLATSSASLAKLEALCVERERIQRIENEAGNAR